jgi:CheY-like chemotaxis protein
MRTREAFLPRASSICPFAEKGASNQWFTGDAMSVYQNRIMIVNDSDSVCLGLKDVLVDRGYTRIEFDDGSGVQRKLADRHYDLLIQDLQRPSPNGFEFYYWIKRQESLSNIPIVLATASSPLYLDESRKTVVGGMEFEGTYRVDFAYNEEEFGPKPEYISSRASLFVEGYWPFGWSMYGGDTVNILDDIFDKRAAVEDPGDEYSLRNALLWPVVLRLLTTSRVL